MSDPFTVPHTDEYGRWPDNEEKEIDRFYREIFEQKRFPGGLTPMPYEEEAE